MSLPDILAATTPVVEALEALSVPYHLGGSVVSSLHGVPRSTIDVDLVADLRGRHVEPLVERLVDTYYIDLDAVSVAVAQRLSFNVIHLETMLKVDIFVLGSSPFEQEIFDRKQEDTLEDVEGAKPFFVATAEDIVLHKLHWYNAGDCVSERQWRDVIGVLKVTAPNLDFEHLRRWSEEIGVAELLDRAFDEAGISGAKRTDDV